VLKSGTATVHYDETRLHVSDIKSDVRQSGYEREAASATNGMPEARSRARNAATLKRRSQQWHEFEELTLQCRLQFSHPLKEAAQSQRAAR